MSNTNPGSQPDNNGKSDRYSSDDASKSKKEKPADRPATGGTPLMDNVLHETLSAANSEEIVPLITRFVQENQNADINDIDVAARLVERIIDARMGSHDLPDGIFRWVAEQLLDDPDSHERLENLWSLAKNQTA
jgi:hypothetical protein